ncbi:CAP domain-containing protein [Streptomyces sp. NPDC056632]|uniref:CAP domain-containing protein n=1 Tax=Streptomyces sp. NPDC056632 TaxID=3345884 RepID=UPI0036C4BDF0
MAKKRGRGVRKTGKSSVQRRRPSAPPAVRKAPVKSRPVLPSLLDDEEGSAGWVPAAAAPRPVPPGRSPNGGDREEARRRRMEEDVVVLVNERRRSAGLPPLRVDERLRESSRAHSADMAARGFFSHEAPGGVQPVDRMRRAGYPAPAAENIARGQQTAAGAMRGWMNSPGHRANILREGLATIGVGVHLGAGGPWWTQNFGYEPQD